MKISILLDKLSRPQVLWAVIFFYTLASGLFVQLILLPHIVPSWHQGNGLIEGMDGRKFHRIALELSQAIQTKGWGAWEPLPQDQIVSGIAAIFYTLIYPAPWSVLPFNALLNAFTGTGFYLLMGLLVGDEKKGLVATLPFIFFPSAMLWNTQFHNENYVVPGVVFILLGWMIIYSPKYHLPHIRPAMGLSALALIALGGLFLLVTREETLLAMSVLCATGALVMNGLWLWQKIKAAGSTRILLYRVSLSWLACILMLVVQSFNVLNDSRIRPGDSVRAIEKFPEDPSKVRDSGRNGLKWQQSAWLPKFIDVQFNTLAMTRASFLRGAQKSGSLIDEQMAFESAHDIIVYVPRALEIGLFSPFPHIWFEKSGEASGSAMRLEAAAEMAFAYVCLLGLPIFAWKNRRKHGFFPMLWLCVGMLILYAITTPNQGALYRFRYPFYMPLVCVGLSGWLLRGQPEHAEMDDSPVP